MLASELAASLREDGVAQPKPRLSGHPWHCDCDSCWEADTVTLSNAAAQAQALAHAQGPSPAATGTAAVEGHQRGRPQRPPTVASSTRTLPMPAGSAANMPYTRSPYSPVQPLTQDSAAPDQAPPPRQLLRFRASAQPQVPSQGPMYPDPQQAPPPDPYYPSHSSQQLPQQMPQQMMGPTTIVSPSGSTLWVPASALATSLEGMAAGGGGQYPPVDQPQAYPAMMGSSAVAVAQGQYAGYPSPVEAMPYGGPTSQAPDVGGAAGQSVLQPMIMQLMAQAQALSAFTG
eukprot:RCo022344